MSTLAAWAAPTQDALSAAATVISEAERQGNFSMPPALSGLVGILRKPAAPPPAPTSPTANVVQAPAPRPGFIARAVAWAKARPLIAAGIAAVVLALGVLLLRRKG